jgi:hypothetical protein
MTTSTMLECKQVGKFEATDPAVSDELGDYVAVQNDIVVVGAQGENSFTGSVYVLAVGSMMTTTAPTTKPVATPTPVSILSPIPRPTNTIAPSSENEDDTAPPRPLTNTSTFSSTATILPSTISPSPTSNPAMNDNDIETKPPSPVEQAKDGSNTAFTPGVIVGVSASVVVGEVMILKSILNYRIKIHNAEAREHYPKERADEVEVSKFNVPWIRELARKQSECGWRNFFKGMLLLDWHEVIHNHFQNIHSMKSPRRWLSALIRKMWQIAWDLWEHQNGFLHNKDITILSIQTDAKIMEQFKIGEHQLDHATKSLFRNGLQAILSKPLEVKQQWLGRVDAAWINSALGNHNNFHSERQSMARWLGLQG